MDERGLPANPQGWCSWHRGCDGGRLCDKPGSQSLGPPGSHQVGSLQSTAGPQDIYSEGGWFASAARHPDLRGQAGAAGDRHGAGGGVRAGLPSLLIRIPARSIGTSGIADSAYCACMSQRLRWVLDIDIVKYFDSIPHSHLRDFLDRRVTDGVIRRMIDKWLKAGVLEDGLLRHATEGSPQGGVISPCLSNIFLHHVLDEWFELEVRPRLKGRCTL